MQTLERPQKTFTTDFKRLLMQGAGEITQHWLEAVRADSPISSIESVGETLTVDSVSSVLDEILRATALDESKIEHKRISSAAVHGRERARQHFEIKGLVREFQLLREQIFLFLHDHLAQFESQNKADGLSVYHRVGLAIDEAMSETINAYVIEHTAQLFHLSRTDSLTRLYNHRTFYEILDEELKRAKRYENPLAIVFIDLDNFKVVNDTRGHQFGDYLLVKCADFLRHELRETDIICRYGGDEFGVILPETNCKHASAMMDRLSAAFKLLGAQEGAPASFGMSFGLATDPDDDRTVVHLVHAADERLRLNKLKNQEDG